MGSFPSSWGMLTWVLRWRCPPVSQTSRRSNLWMECTVLFLRSVENKELLLLSNDISTSLLRNVRRLDGWDEHSPIINYYCVLVRCRYANSWIELRLGISPPGTKAPRRNYSSLEKMNTEIRSGDWPKNNCYSLQGSRAEIKTHQSELKSVKQIYSPAQIFHYFVRFL
jgi:hypothetical protein